MPLASSSALGMKSVGRTRAKKRLTGAQCIKMARDAENVGGFKECFAEIEPPETGLPCPVADAVERGGWKIAPGYEDAKRHVKLIMPYDQWQRKQSAGIDRANSMVEQEEPLGIEDDSIKNVKSTTKVKEIDGTDLNPNG